MRRLFSRYMDGVETVPVRDIAAARRELNRSPAQALIMNAPWFDSFPTSMAQLADLPYGIPTMACWTPGKDEATKRLNVVNYLVKPVSREALLLALEELGKEIQTVLLVDDEPEALQLFARMLSSGERRYRVLRAAGGEQALELLRKRRPDVMLLDLIMPGMDGFQVLREKEKEAATRTIPVVVVSSRDPANRPIVSNMLTVTQSGGLSARDLCACIQALSGALSPSV